MQYFFHNIIKKYIIAFSYLINDIHVQKFDESNQLQKDILVPITYASRMKTFTWVNAKHSMEINDVGLGIVLPRISFVDDAPIYDPTRKRSDTLEYGNYNNYVGEPVPYNIPINISIFSKTKDDMYQILEQFLTLFTPDITITVEEVANLGIINDIIIQLESINYSNSDDLTGTDEDRILITDMTFTLKGWLYSRVKESKIIYTVNLDLFNWNITPSPTLTNINISVTHTATSIDTTTVSTVITNYV